MQQYIKARQCRLPFVVELFKYLFMQKSNYVKKKKNLIKSAYICLHDHTKILLMLLVFKCLFHC